MAALKIENLITDHLDLWTAAVRPKSSAGRGSNSKLELTGIKKLRELILELAVRGKLVPQDPSDEPASVLLERIAAEKTRLVADGKIKKPKALPEISEEEKPFALPEGWEWAKLGVCSADIHYGYTASANHDLSDYKLLRITDIQNNTVDWEKVPGCEISSEQAQGYLLSDGDILIARTGGTIGKSYLVENIDVHSVFASYLIRIRRLDSIYAPYVKTFLGANIYWRQLEMVSMGTGQPNVNGNSLKNLNIPLPPLEEQHRIVAKVDELMVLCDQLEQRSESQLAAHQTLVEALLATLTDSTDADELAQNWTRLSSHFDTLFTTEASIDALKQTILQLAVMGKLVPQDPSNEPASALLERIATQKAQLVKEKKIKKEKPLLAISEDEKPFELPQGWEWCHLKDIITIMDAGWSPACPPEASPDIDTWGVLKTTAVQTLEYRDYENKVLDKTKTPRPENEVMVGDILITRAGPKNRVGISCLVEKTRPKLMISDKIIRFHLVEVGLSERFISLCLNAGATAVYIDGSKSGMAESQMNISQDKLKLAPIPLGPIKEQNHIMDRVDQLMTLCDQLKTRLQTSQQTQLALAESLVEGALA
ncbi:restriction endonuclease subunit S [Aeromonas sanarellii]|uniref:restriction endonuclease subunit S n=1 Tax=Aeromonas sanarellii TaxID=633415 RepID=UPI0038CF3E18